MALQEAAEAYLVSLFEDTNLAAIHAKRELFSFTAFVVWNADVSQVSRFSPKILPLPVVSVASVLKPVVVVHPP
jgi:hypothetical protein